ncbi:hypothetical protein J6590_048352 [Homalodisca vitripennis]|nr:hypothetical protein J6590_048352 [Homalodisca vitripennis]
MQNSRVSSKRVLSPPAPILGFDYSAGVEAPIANNELQLWRNFGGATPEYRAPCIPPPPTIAPNRNTPLTENTNRCVFTPGPPSATQCCVTRTTVETVSLFVPYKQQEQSSVVGALQKQPNYR